MDETRTSTEVYHEYCKLRDMERKVERQGGGLNLLNADEFLKPKQYHIEVTREAHMTLTHSEHRLVVNSDIRLGDHYGAFGTDLEDFLEELKEWASTPRYKFFLCWNRRRENQVSRWSVIDPRTIDIRFENVTIDIGEEAQKELASMGLDLKAKIKEMFSLQRDANAQEEKDFERYYLLLHVVDDLKRQVMSRDNNYSYYNREGRDYTIKLCMSEKDYTKKRKKAIDELKALVAKYPCFRECWRSYGDDD